MEKELHHIAFLHTELAQKDEDLYLIDAALALERIGHQVTIYTSSFDKCNVLDPVHPTRGQLRVVLSGWWLPKSIFGGLKALMDKIRAVWIAFRIVVSPPIPKPKSVIVDTDPSALFILSWLGEYDALYIQHFEELQNCEFFHDYLKIDIGFFGQNALKYARKIIVKTESLANIFKRSSPRNSKKVAVLCPSCNIGIWAEDLVDLKSFLPKLPQDYILFVAFGSYIKRSNFGLLVQALDYFYAATDGPVRTKAHIVIAGNYDDKSQEQDRHYRSLVHNVNLQPYCGQMSFVKNPTAAQKKSLIHGCAAVLHPVVDDIFPGPALLAMSMERPVIAVDSGFSKQVLIHNLTGMLVDPNPVEFAKMMQVIAFKPSFGTFMGVMARENFEQMFSFDVFCDKINQLILKKGDHPLPKLPMICGCSVDEGINLRNTT